MSRARIVRHTVATFNAANAPAVTVRMEWRTDNPYAVEMEFQVSPGRATEWVVSRDLLTEGLTSPVGWGDIRVAPSSNSGQTTIELRSPTGRAGFEFHTTELTEFLAATHRRVPVGAEVLDIDTALAELLEETANGQP